MSTTRAPIDPVDSAASATTSADDPETDTTRGDLPLPDQAWRRFCRGESYSAIARALNVERRTIARYIKQLHEQTQTDRRAERTLALTQALGALQQIQAGAWEQIDLDQGHERVVWDLYLRAVADVAAESGSYSGGQRVRPPTFRPQTARLLTLILNAVRQISRLEFLDDPTAPTRQGDLPTDQPKDAYWYFMMRRSDQEELARMNQHPGAPGAVTPAPDPSSDAPDAASAAPDVPNHDDGDPSIPAVPPFEVRDADGNIPIEHTHPKPALRPDGTDDWYVHKRVPLPPLATARPSLGPPRRRRPWDRQW
jgi:hypothetical protein